MIFFADKKKKTYNAIITIIIIRSIHASIDYSQTKKIMKNNYLNKLSKVLHIKNVVIFRGIFQKLDDPNV